MGKKFQSEMRKLILFYIFFISLFSCQKKDNPITFEAARINSLSYDSENVTYKTVNTERGEEEYIEIKMDYVEHLKDTIDAHQLIGSAYLYRDGNLIFKSNDAKVVSAEKITYLYPTLWATDGMECIQFVYLYDLPYVEKENLIVRNGIITYPSDFKMSSSAKKFFKELRYVFRTKSVHSFR